MARRRFLWQLFPSYLFITLVALFAVTFSTSHIFRQFYLDNVEEDLESRARLAECHIAPQLLGDEAAAVENISRKLGERSNTRITVILPSGKVIGDSRENPGRMDNHAERPEIREALAGRIGTSTRYSFTLRQTMMYVAVPLKHEGEVEAAVRTALPVTAIEDALGSQYFEIAIWGLGIALIAALISLIVSRRITRPLETLRDGADKFARGELEHRLNVTGSLEIASLAESMNQMASKLDHRIRTVLKQRNEQQAVLSSMVEGVLGVDDKECLISMNPAASRMLEVDERGAGGRTIQEIVRNTDLQRFVSRALASNKPIEKELVFGENRDRLIQAHGTVLRGENNERIGALIVLNDITRLRQLENIRRDFVANVSHELKTPITSILGSVETLLDGALDDKEDARRFLEITRRHADRLAAIIDDLLSLSRIEQETERREISLTICPVADVLTSAMRFCEDQAEAAGIRLECDCRSEIMGRINAPLLEQAVINLLTNAIKYSDTGGVVWIEMLEEGERVVINIRDEGLGIAEEHLPRLFERFYRVDKARSRKQGGTGLGLAIAKHITQAHGGRISVKSRPGEGSVFTISLPSPCKHQESCDQEP